MANPITVEIAPGELIDKLTILRIKAARIDDPAKVANVVRERDLLAARWHALPGAAALNDLVEELTAINAALWQIEDDIRDCERAGDFGPRFIELARSVYKTNDRRAAVKRAINEALGSTIIEEKSYSACQAATIPSSPAPQTRTPTWAPSRPPIRPSARAAMFRRCQLGGDAKFRPKPAGGRQHGRVINQHDAFAMGLDEV